MYRGRTRRCPACRAPMRVLPVVSHDGEPVEVDVCGECGGAMLDFFDGEASHVAREAFKRAGAPRRPRDTVESELACPDCDAPMQAAAYLGDGPIVARCGECMCLFATRAELARLATYAQEREAPGLLTRIRRALGLGRSRG